MSSQLTRAVQIVEGACAQICAYVAPPGHSISNKALQYQESTCLRVAANTKVADYLLGKPDGVQVEELAQQTKLDAGKLSRVLRVLTTKHVFREVKPNVFANNRLSMKLLSTDLVSVLVDHHAGECMRGSAYLWDVLVDPEYGPSHDAEHTAFRKAHGRTIFKYYFEDPRGQLEGKRVPQAMAGWGNVTGKGLLPKIYSWSDLPEDTLICDVGGNSGHVTLDLLKVYPKLKVVVQDLKELQPVFQETWSTNLPTALEQHRVDFEGFDFFREPPRNNCDIYYIRHILHDWPDAECVKILQNVKAAMAPTSKILIHEFVLLATSRDRFDSDARLADGSLAPEPLLPNYGAGRTRAYYQDINMLCALNSKERTLQEFINLGAQAGLTFVKLWDSGETALVEFTL